MPPLTNAQLTDAVTELRERMTAVEAVVKPAPAPAPVARFGRLSRPADLLTRYPMDQPFPRATDVAGVIENMRYGGQPNGDGRKRTPEDQAKLYDKLEALPVGALGEDEELGAAVVLGDFVPYDEYAALKNPATIEQGAGGFTTADDLIQNNLDAGRAPVVDDDRAKP
jgi:hypothetical protein